MYLHGSYAIIYQDWHLDEVEDILAYSHLNIKIDRTSLSESATGILGSTVRLKHDAQGNPILHAHDKDGQGVLDGKAERSKSMQGIADLCRWSYSTGIKRRLR